MPIFYRCDRCTACCRWPGHVLLSAEEIRRLAEFKGLTESQFIQTFTRLREDRQGLALEDQANGDCIFLEGNDCTVQAVKPQQCRDFPNRWNFPGFEKVCRAVPMSVEEAEYRQLMAAATGRADGLGDSDSGGPVA